MHTRPSIGLESEQLLLAGQQINIHQKEGCAVCSKHYLVSISHNVYLKKGPYRKKTKIFVFDRGFPNRLRNNFSDLRETWPNYNCTSDKIRSVRANHNA